MKNRFLFRCVGLLVMVGCSLTKATDCEVLLSGLKQTAIRQQVLKLGKELSVPSEQLEQLVNEASFKELRSVVHTFEKLTQKEPVSLKDYAELARVLKTHGAPDFLKFHTTPEGTIDKILSSQVDGQHKPHLRPGSYEWTIYALDSPANQSSLGAARALSTKSQGKEAVVFQGEAANLFKSHPATGLIPFYKYLNGEKVVGMNRIVIDESNRNGDTLVVTKAHLEPLSGKQAVQGYVGAALFHINEIILIGASVLCLFSC